MSNKYVNVGKIGKIAEDVSLSAEEARIMVDTIVDLSWYYRDEYYDNVKKIKAGLEKIELIALSVSEKLKSDKFRISISDI